MVLGMTGKRAYNWCVSLVAASCMVLYGYDASVFNTDTETIGGINTAYTVGAVIGGFFFGGPIADFAGRKIGMSVGCILVIIATFMQTFAPRGGIATFIGGRVLIGLGQGIALTAGPIYIGELAPPEIRGKIMSFWQMFYSVGSFIAYCIGYATKQHNKGIGEWDWKTVVIFQLLVPITILTLVFFLPGSPRWYIQHSNNIEKALEFEKEAISSGYIALWKDRSVRKRLLLAFVINAGQQITGQGTLNSYSTIIYKNVFADGNKIALINALNASFGILFTLNATWTVDRFGRKFLLIVGGIGMGLCMLIVAIVGSETPGTTTKSEPIGISIVFLLFLFAFFYKPSWGATVWIWTSEIFSMNVRAQAVGMASQTQNVANSIFQQFFPTFLKHDNFYTFYFFAGINLCLAAFVYFFIPETKNVVLEEMDTLFGGSNHIEKGGDLLHVEDAHHAALEPGMNTNDFLTDEGRIPEEIHHVKEKE